MSEKLEKLTRDIEDYIFDHSEEDRNMTAIETLNYLQVAGSFIPADRTKKGIKMLCKNLKLNLVCYYPQATAVYKILYEEHVKEIDLFNQTDNYHTALAAYEKIKKLVKKLTMLKVAILDMEDNDNFKNTNKIANGKNFAEMKKKLAGMKIIK